MSIRVLYSAYWCNPYRGSEWQAGFKWLEILLENYEVILFTSNASKDSLLEFYKQTVPVNLQIQTFNDKNRIPRKIREVIHLEYFLYNRNLKKFITANPEHNIFQSVDLILHKNPSSFRYSTPLYLVDKPLVIGPLGGGLQIPQVLKKYLKSDSWLRKLRKYDKLLFKLPVYKKQFDKADKILVSFDYIREFLPETYKNKIQTIFDTGIVVDEANTANSKTDNPEVKILTVGRLILAKGTALTIQALSKIKTKSFHFHIVGDGPERQNLENLTKELNLEDKITFHGNVPYEQVDNFYRDADIFCFPTLKEAGGTVILEAMKAALPIITMNYGGPQYICPTSGSFKIPVSSPQGIVDGLAEKLDLLLDSPDLRSAMGNANFTHCKQHYTWKTVKEDIKKLIDHYNK